MKYLLLCKFQECLNYGSLCLSAIEEKINILLKRLQRENKVLGTPENKAAQQDAKEVDHLIQQTQPLVSEIKRLQ